MPVKKTKDISLQQKIDELNQLLSWFDAPDYDIEVAIEKFEKASQLRAEIEKDLTVIGNKITVLKKSFDQDISK